jgi:hypothetical protein
VEERVVVKEGATSVPVGVDLRVAHLGEMRGELDQIGRLDPAVPRCRPCRSASASAMPGAPTYPTGVQCSVPHHACSASPSLASPANEHEYEPVGQAVIKLIHGRDPAVPATEH